MATSLTRAATSYSYIYIYTVPPIKLHLRLILSPNLSWLSPIQRKNQSDSSKYLNQACFKTPLYIQRMIVGKLSSKKAPVDHQQPGEVPAVSSVPEKNQGNKLEVPLFVEATSSRWCFNTHGWNTPAKLECMCKPKLRCVFLFVHCQEAAKHKLTFGNLRFSKRNCSSKSQENNIAARTQFCSEKTQPLIFHKPESYMTSIFEGVSYSLNYLNLGWCHCFHYIMYPKWRKKPTQNWDHISSARYNQNVSTMLYS